MQRTLVAGLVLVTLAVGLWADDVPKAKSRAADEYEALVEEYREVRRPREFAEKFLALAAKHPGDGAAIDALAWVLTNDAASAAAQRAVDLLLKDHLASGKLVEVCKRLSESESLAAERLLRTLQERSPNRGVQAQACFSLAGLLRQQISYAVHLKENPAERKRIEKFLGEECTKHVASLDPAKIEAEREQLYETILKSYADAKVEGSTLVVPAKRELFVIRHLSVGKVAADIEGEDLDGVKFKLSDYRGKVVLLDFWGDW
jgi:hypothetical protein